MTEHDGIADDGHEPGMIGVGMGGSCPVCRAPIDLGQEFCLECGSPIRFTPRQRRQQRAGDRPAAPPAAPPTPPRHGGFPWIPFLVVLVLIGGGAAFALVDGDSSDSSSKGSEKTEPALPVITNSVPETTSTTQTTTLQDCDPAQPLDGTQPAVVDPTTGATSPTDTTFDGEQIPELSLDGTETDAAAAPVDPFSDAVPSTEPSTTDGETVTVDQDGNLCPTDATDLATTDPTTGAPIVDPATTTTTTTPTATTPTTTTSTSGDWPSGKQGWTVIVAGYPTEQRATQGAADVQEDGFTDGGVLFSSDFQSLCPGIYVVYSGVFDDRAQAKARLQELQAKGYSGMYDREIRTTGAAPGNCS